VDRWTGGLDAGFPSRHGHLSHGPDAWIVLPERLIAGHESQEVRYYQMHQHDSFRC
jgi:hypothetical protein